MIYRDNDAFIVSPYIDDKSFKREYTVVGGTCLVTGVSITEGQDPSGYNYVGQQKSIGEGGRLRFNVGRKGSFGVASWWNQRVSAGQCTFNHAPGKLNFAFNVDLVVHLTGGNLGSRVARIRLDDVHIGQGRAGTSNNWWFGGRHCTHIGGDKVRIEGLDLDTNLKVHVDVKRGGASNPVNHFEFSNYRVANTHNWMSLLSSATPLNRIVLPGSHDAGLGQTRHCNPQGLGQALSRTQLHSILGQLNHGARYFDIRVDYDKERLVTYHRTDAYGCSGEYVDSVLASVNAFLTSNPSETVILKFSHTRDYKRDPLVTKRLLDQQIERFDKRFRQATVSNLATVPLGELRGKAVMVFDYDEHLSKETGRYRYRDGTLGGDLAVYDQYSNTPDLRRMLGDQLSKWQQYAGLGQYYLFLLSWTLTPRVLTTPDTLALAKLANADLPEALRRYSREYGSKPNIVYIDAVDRSVTSAIIALNDFNPALG